MSTSIKSNTKAPAANANAVRAYVSTASDMNADYAKRARSLVAKYAGWLASGKISVDALRLSVEAAQVEIKAGDPATGRLPMEDPLGWAPSWAARVTTVHAMMNLTDGGSEGMTLKAMFALAEDLRVKSGDDGKAQGTPAAREAVAVLADSAKVEAVREIAKARLLSEVEAQFQPADEETDEDKAARVKAAQEAADTAIAKAESLTPLQAMRIATPRKPQAARKSSHGLDTFDPAVALNTLLESLQAYVKDHDGRVPEAVRLAMESFREGLDDLEASVKIAK